MPLVCLRNGISPERVKFERATGRPVDVAAEQQLGDQHPLFCRQQSGVGSRLRCGPRRLGAAGNQQ